MKNQYKIINISDNGKTSLVAVSLEGADDFIEVSIQNSKNLKTNPKIALLASKPDFNKFIKKLEKELETHSTPDLYTVAQLYCSSMCEILRVIKVDNESYDVFMYYNYRRPFSRRCKDYVNFSSDELKKFIKGN